MSPPASVHPSPLVAQSEPDIPRFERIAVLLGLGAFVVVLAVGFVLHAVKFQVDHDIVKAALWTTVIVAIAVFLRIRPASSLTPTERMVRSKRQIFFLVGLEAGIAVMLSIVTAGQLHTAEDWGMLIFILSSPIGIGIMLNTHFGMG